MVLRAERRRSAGNQQIGIKSFPGVSQSKDSRQSPCMPPIGITPYPDESLVSFIFRFARRRRLLSGPAFARSVGFEWLTNRPRPDWLAVLAEASEVPLEQLEAISFGPPDSVVCELRGRRIRAKFLDHRGAAERKVCPACLREASYHRAIWDLSFISACPHHSALLVDECSCGQPLRWGGSDLTRNRCEKRCDLTRIGAPSVGAGDIEGAKAAAGLLGDEEFSGEAARVRALPPHEGLEDGEIVDFLYRLGLESVGGRKKIFSVEDVGELAWTAHELLNHGIAASSQWPAAFYAILDAMAARIPRRAPRAAAVTAVLRWLDGLEPGRGVAIRAAVDDYRDRRPGRAV